jgi:transketolase
MTDPASNSQAALVALAEHARRIRVNAVRMAAVQGQGYVAQALGVADVLSVLYFRAMSYRPEDPKWEGRDRLLLSIGHYAIALYAALVEAGILRPEDIETYGSDDSRLPMSGMSSYTPGMEISGGSLGHGLGIAVGMGLGLKRKRSSSRVFNLLSDGELNEGSTWEAALSASRWKLDNLIAVVDVNNQQADGASSDVLPFEPLADKWLSFGWAVWRIDGNDLPAVVAAFDEALSDRREIPRIVICDTKMAKGVPFLEARDQTHFIRVDEDEWAKALAALGEPA